MVFLVLFLLPALIGLGLLIFGKHRFSLLEFGVQMLAQLIVAGLCVWAIFHANTTDINAINGRVTDKKRVEVSCSHHHCCRWCTSRSCDSKGRCSTSTYCCGWCDDHPFDVDWNVYTNVGKTVDINRLSRQGLEEPPRWTKVYKGEPVSFEERYTNYIKASPNSLFRREADYSKFKGLPEYPGNFYDYYKLDRIVLVGVQMPEGAQAWDLQLDEINADLGRAKQANIVVVFVKGQTEEYFYALERKWIGGKKNDIVIVTGVDDQLKPLWQNTMGWTKNEMVKVKLRDDILAMDRISLDTFMPMAKEAVLRYYERKPMKDFEYLKASITPTPKGWVFSLLIGFVVACGLGWYFYHYDPFESGMSEDQKQRMRGSAQFRSIYR